MRPNVKIDNNITTIEEGIAAIMDPGDEVIVQELKTEEFMIVKIINFIIEII